MKTENTSVPQVERGEDRKGAESDRRADGTQTHMRDTRRCSTPSSGHHHPAQLQASSFLARHRPPAGDISQRGCRGTATAPRRLPETGLT